MFSRKVIITLLVLAIVTEEVASHKLFLGAVHLANKVAIAKLRLLRPIARGLVTKKILAVKLLGAKALIGAKLGLGALALSQLQGLATAGAKKAPITTYGKTGVTRSATGNVATPVARSAITFPEINVPVRFSVGAPQPPIRSDNTRQAAKM